jgi:methyl-accepting chemotaxis protein
MAIKRKARLSPLNVAYGVGAAVVITGAMFKFLNWRFANEMLFVGLATEAIVFFISAFELTKDEVDYKWDKVFPQLTTDEPTNIEKLDEMIEKVNLDSGVIERLSDSIGKLEQNVARLADASNTAQLQDQLDKMRQTTENFEVELTRLNSSISRLNTVYEKMLDAMQNK